MSVVIPEKDLPAELSAEQAVEAAYSAELVEIAGAKSVIETWLRYSAAPEL